jgi:hypothetical protein
MPDAPDTSELLVDPAVAFTRALRLRAALIRERHYRRMLRHAGDPPHDSPPTWEDWAQPSILPSAPAAAAPAHGEPVTPQVPLVHEIMAQVLRRYHWGLRSPRRTQGEEPDVPRQRTTSRPRAGAGT